MTRNTKRPLSPHLSIWKWGPAMATSIGHRVTGNGLATVGAVLLVGWFVALASGQQCYDWYMSYATWWPGKVVAVGLTWFFFQHLFGGLRHFVLDTGAGYQLQTNKMWSLLVWAGAILATALVWLLVMWKAL